MRCLSCNNPLSKFESTRKTPAGEYLDLCNQCFKPIADQVHVIERPDLLGVDDSDD